MDISIFKEEVYRQFPVVTDNNYEREIDCELSGKTTICIWIYEDTNKSFIQIDNEVGYYGENYNCSDLYRGGDVTRAASILFGLTGNSVWLDFIK